MKDPPQPNNNYNHWKSLKAEKKKGRSGETTPTGGRAGIMKTRFAEDQNIINGG
jgi:hypothetical protein